MKYKIIHKTTYSYSEPASLSQNELYLTPRETAFQRVAQSGITIAPEPDYMKSRIDYFGNRAHVFMVQHPHRDLSMTAESEVSTAPQDVPDPACTPSWETVNARLKNWTNPEDLSAYQYVFASPLISISPAVRAYGSISFTSGAPILSAALDLTHRIFTDFTYDKTATTVDTPVSRVLANRKGVCQDFAHLAISVFRSLGLAARYVSGYLETLPPPGKPKLIGADASHAWVSLYVPDHGWIDLDPTNDQITGESHITLGWGRDYGDITPVKGVVMGGGIHTLSVMVDVNAQT